MAALIYNDRRTAIFSYNGNCGMSAIFINTCAIFGVSCVKCVIYKIP